ncbi:MAG: hypothetical protein LOD91_03555 [Limnochordales bacterium]
MRQRSGPQAAARTRRASMGLAVALALAVGLAPAAGAQETSVRGQLEYQLGYGYDQGATVENALNLKLALERPLGWDGKVHVGVDGRAAAVGEPSRLELDEAYVDWYTASTDWRVGRQVINWGTADGLNPTNVINPRAPLSPAALALSSEPIRGTPVWAVQASYYLPSGASLTGVGVAAFEPAPGGMDMVRAMAARLGALMGGGPLPVEDPAPVPADGRQLEWAVRGDTLLGNHNVYLSYFRGWDDYPATWLEYTLVPTPDGPKPVPERIVTAYRQVHKFGLATAGTLGGAGVWTELAYTAPDAIARLDGPGALSSNEGYLEAVVGADYTFANGVTVSGQVIYHGGGSLLSPYKSPEAGVKPQTYGLGMARWSPEPGHQLEGILLANLRDGGVIAVGRYTYDITQAIKLIVGASHVMAGRGSEFDLVRAAANVVTAGLEVNF